MPRNSRLLHCQAVGRGLFHKLFFRLEQASAFLVCFKLGQDAAISPAALISWPELSGAAGHAAESAAFHSPALIQVWRLSPRRVLQPVLWQRRRQLVIFRRWLLVNRLICD